MPRNQIVFFYLILTSIINIIIEIIKNFIFINSSFDKYSYVFIGFPFSQGIYGGEKEFAFRFLTMC
jgi:accessory gene regulator protein AgrB